MSDRNQLSDARMVRESSTIYIDLRIVGHPGHRGGESPPPSTFAIAPSIYKPQTHVGSISLGFAGEWRQ